MVSSYSKFTYNDLDAIGVSVEQMNWLKKPTPIEPSDWLKVTLAKNMDLPLSSEKAKTMSLLHLALLMTVTFHEA